MLNRERIIEAVKLIAFFAVAVLLMILLIKMFFAGIEYLITEERWLTSYLFEMYDKL